MVWVSASPRVPRESLARLEQQVSVLAGRISACTSDVRTLEAANEQKITDELMAAQGPAQDIGGYYMPDKALTDAAMRPSATFNGIIARVNAGAGVS